MVMDITYDNLNSQLSLFGIYLSVFVGHLDALRRLAIRTFSGTPNARKQKSRIRETLKRLDFQ